MKKPIAFLCIALIICCVMPCFAADITEKDIIGAWTTTFRSVFDEPVIANYYFLDDSQAFHAFSRVKNDGTTVNECTIGTWELHGDYIYFVFGDGMNDTKYLQFIDGFIKEKSGGDDFNMYGKAPTWEEAHDQSNSAIIPQGEYTISADIPAGRYTIDAGTARRITVWIYPPEGFSDYYYIGTEENEKSVVVNLQEGGRLKIDGASVYLKKFSGLDLTNLIP